MRFRTEIEQKPSPVEISHRDKIIMLGSCFTDNIGERLTRDGFDVLANPFGPFFNPVSISNIVSQEPSLMVEMGENIHCLDLPSIYRAEKTKVDELSKNIDFQYTQFHQFLTKSTVAIITLGSAHVYTHISSGRIVANCHKFPACEFEQRTLSLTETTEAIKRIVSSLKEYGVQTILFTISPVRHLDKGLSGNFLSKATLRLALESVLSTDVLYFPAFEILNDDLRDYRFYAADMKHPSDVAVDYIYEIFGNTFFSRETKGIAEKAHQAWKRQQHRTIIKQ